MIPHWAGVSVAIIGGLALIAGMLFGSMPMPRVFGVDRHVRQICVALWTFLLPAWFSIDDYWAPPSTQKEALEEYRSNQQAARNFWTVLGGAAAIIIGAAVPSGGTPSIPAVPQGGAVLTPLKRPEDELHQVKP